MDFDLPEDLKMVQSLARDFVRDQLKPLERDLLGRSADLSDARARISPADEQRLASTAKELGLWAAAVPEDFGGGGLGTLAACVIAEELAQSAVPFGCGDVTPLLFDCSEAQRAAYLAPAVAGAKAVVVGIAESGTDFPEIAATAARSGGQFVLNGRKLAFSAPGDDFLAIIFANTGAGATAFLVDGGAAGLRAIDGQAERGWRAAMRAPLLLVLEDCRVPAANVLGQEGRAFTLGRRWLPGRRIVRAARSVGAAVRLLEEASTRAQTWQSFGRPVAERASVQGALAEAAASIHACRLMVYEAAVKADRGEPVRREAAIARLFAAQIAAGVASRVSAIYGGPAQADVRGDGAVLDVLRHIIAGDVLKGLKV